MLRTRCIAVEFGEPPGMAVLRRFGQACPESEPEERRRGMIAFTTYLWEESMPSNRSIQPTQARKQPKQARSGAMVDASL